AQARAHIKDGHFQTPPGQGAVAGPVKIRVIGQDGTPGGDHPDGKSLFPLYEIHKDLPRPSSTLSIDRPADPVWKEQPAEEKTEEEKPEAEAKKPAAQKKPEAEQKKPAAEKKPAPEKKPAEEKPEAEKKPPAEKPAADKKPADQKKPSGEKK